MNIIAQEESNDVEEIMKDVEQKLKFESFIEKNLFQAENFLGKNDWNIMLNLSHHFHQNIERVWPYFENLSKFLKSFKLDQKIKVKEPKEDEIRNLIEGNFYDSVYHAKILKFKNLSEFKKIVWIFYLENNEIFKIKINLYKITYDNSTVIDFKINYVPKLGQYFLDQLIPEVNDTQIFQEIESEIQKKFNAIYQYESCLIQGKLEEIWDILSDNSKLVLIAPNNECFLPLNINNIKIGQINDLKININDKESVIKVKLDLLRKQTGNKWIFCYTILGGKPFDILKQSLFVQLTRINNQETQLSIFTRIYENIKGDMVFYLSNKKKYVLLSLKDYFINFYSPQDIDNTE
jgi:hypothetical protein